MTAVFDFLELHAAGLIAGILVAIFGWLIQISSQLHDLKCGIQKGLLELEQTRERQRESDNRNLSNELLAILKAIDRLEKR